MRNLRKRDLKEDRSMIQKAFRVAWPAVLESFFVAFVGIVDSMMVSRIGTYAVAEIGRAHV